MRFHAILNRDGGTLRTIDLARFEKKLSAILSDAGHEVVVETVSGPGMEDALDRAARDEAVDVILAGGGDGTISAAAGRLMDTDKALAVLPAGTMNLFARSLGVPLDIEAAVESFAHGAERLVDVATANGKPFIHQFSIGLHARVVQLRSRYEYGSRFGKMLASLRAGLVAMANPPSLRVELDMGEASVVATTSGIGVSNNLFGEGHMPYTDQPDGGMLGIYVSRAASRAEVAWMLIGTALGRWNDLDQVEIHEATSCIMKVHTRRRLRCVIDGELGELAGTTELRIRHKVLKVLAPAGQQP